MSKQSRRPLWATRMPISAALLCPLTCAVLCHCDLCSPQALCLITGFISALYPFPSVVPVSVACVPRRPCVSSQGGWPLSPCCVAPPARARGCPSLHTRSWSHCSQPSCGRSMCDPVTHHPKYHSTSHRTHSHFPHTHISSPTSHSHTLFLIGPSTWGMVIVVAADGWCTGNQVKGIGWRC